MKTPGGETLLFCAYEPAGKCLEVSIEAGMQESEFAGGAKAFNYKPHMLAMKLADTQGLPSAGDEYEPVKGLVTSP